MLRVGALQYVVSPHDRQRDLLAALTDAGKTLTSNLHHDDVLKAIMRSVEQLLEPLNWSLFLLDEKTQRLRFELVVGEAASKLRGMTLEMGEGVAGWVAQHRRSVVVSSAGDDPRFSKRFDKASNFCTESILCVPLVSRDRLLGVIQLIKSADDPRRYGAEDLELLVPLADFAAIAIDNARAFDRMERLTLVDDLTQLANGRAFAQALREEIARASRYLRPLSVLFFDLDHFKRINDTFGHAVGSEALRQVGVLLKANARDTDRPVRWGGDEFAVIMPETDKAGAIALANRLRAALPSMPLPPGVQVTASMGVASFPEDGDTHQALLDAADRAMYTAKSRGRDTVCAGFL